MHIHVGAFEKSLGEGAQWRVRRMVVWRRLFFGSALAWTLRHVSADTVTARRFFSFFSTLFLFFMQASSLVRIRPFKPSDEQAVLHVILRIQREEFGVPITVDEQPDLRAIPTFYQQGCGNFWVAEVEDDVRGAMVVGTIGLKDIGAGQAALRKMFVSAPYRGRTFGVAHALLAHLLQSARERGVAEIFLGTTAMFLAAHRFYEKHGFVQTDADALPDRFPRMAVDSRFYRLQLD